MARQVLLRVWILIDSNAIAGDGVCRSVSGADVHASVCGRLEVVVEGVLCIGFCVFVRLHVLHKLPGFRSSESQWTCLRYALSWIFTSHGTCNHARHWHHWLPCLLLLCPLSLLIRQD
ncbi:hypothetical protein S83_021391 [Arachis hypogaea]